MNDVERVKQECKERKIPISKLEKDLCFANGYISQLKKGFFPPERALSISKYLHINLTGIDESNPNVMSNDIAQNDYEREMLMLCRKASEATAEDKKNIMQNFESTIDLYLKAKGIKKE